MVDELELLLPEEAFDGPMQMALDEVLLRQAALPLLRIYRWEAPCVTFGYFQRHEEVRGAFPGVPVVRRWTGGGMVEHGEDLTFSLLIPKGHPAGELPPSGFYRDLHGALAGWLASTLSAEIRLAGEEERQAGPSCFTAPACDDLLLGGRKILGGAQRRCAGALLYQGSLQGVGQPVDPVGMSRFLGRTLVERKLPREVVEEAKSLAERRYRVEEWTCRR